MSTRSKQPRVDEADRSRPASPQALQKRADKILRENGYSVLSERDENRKITRQSRIIKNNLNDAKMQALHGASSSLKPAKKSALTEEMHTTDRNEVMHNTSAEDALIQKQQTSEIEKSLLHIFDHVFEKDKIARIIMICVLREASFDFRNSKEISKITGLSIGQINSAKKRIRYQLQLVEATSIEALMELAKGESE